MSKDKIDSDTESNIDSSLPLTYDKITIMSTNNQNKKRSWDKKYYCAFCEAPQSKIPRHLTQIHQNEPKVIDYLNEGDKKLKKLKMTLLRNLGNHLHNCEVLRNGKGTLIVGYRPSGNNLATAREYGPCPSCYIYLVRTDLWKHKCPAIGAVEGKTKCKSPALSSKLLIPPPKGIKPQLFSLLQKGQDDEISRIIRNDPLLISLGERDYMRLGHDPEQHNTIRQTLRRMGKLVNQLQLQSKCRNLTMKDYIDPTKFQDVVKAAKTVAGFDEKTHKYQIPSLALKLGHTVKRCAKILEGNSLENGNVSVVTMARDFQNLCELNWADQVSTHALRTLYEAKRNKPKLLPLTEDTVLLANFLKAGCHKNFETLKFNNHNTQAWCDLNEYVLARIIIFNRRRQGEPYRLTLEDYGKLSSPNGERVALLGLSDLEKELCRSLYRLETRGKKGATVPILFTASMKEAVDLLIATRGHNGVESDNVFVFARSHYGAAGHIRGVDVLRKFSVECGAKVPESLRSTGLRKQIATVSQIVNLKENELDILAKFLGHDIKVHREYYRLPNEVLQAAKIAKLLLAMEQGNNNMAGKH